MHKALFVFRKETPVYDQDIYVGYDGCYTSRCYSIFNIYKGDEQSRNFSRFYYPMHSLSEISWLAES